MTFWILIAVAGLMVVPCVVGLVVAAVLGQLGKQVSELLEREPPWAAPLVPK
jgi:hypothetical protein